MSWKNNIQQVVVSLQARSDVQQLQLDGLTTDSANLRADLDDHIETATAELLRRQDKTEERIELHRQMVADLVGALEKMELSNTELHNSVSAVSQQSADVANRLRSTAGRHDQLNQKLEALTGSTSARSRQLEETIDELSRKLSQVSDRQQHTETQMLALVEEGAQLLKRRLRDDGETGAWLADARNLYICEESGAALILASFEPQPKWRRGDFAGILQRIRTGAINKVMVTCVPPRAGKPQLVEAGSIGEALSSAPLQANALFGCAEENNDKIDPASVLSYILQQGAENPFTLKALEELNVKTKATPPPPFDLAVEPDRILHATPVRRSAIFLHNNYYHFNNLAAGLRKRGWDTMTVSIESPDSPQRQFYHGEDLNLFDPDPGARTRKIQSFLSSVPERFGALHFYGQWQPSFFPELYDAEMPQSKVPWDLLQLRRHRVVIGYMPSGCMDGARQSDIRRLSNGLCSACIWENNGDVCSDARADAWTERLHTVCDWIGLEGDWAVGARTGGRYVRGPVVTTLDPDQWKPGLDIPSELSVPKEPGEVLIFHAVGNDAIRRRSGRDIKGTGAVMEAIETLRAEGLPVRLAFFSKVPSTQMRFIQSQADIVVDQLRYGRYGANARECMMLGLPTVGYLNARRVDSDDPDPTISACPIVRSDVHTITDTLRSLVQDPAARAQAGRAARLFMLDWHARSVCAERYERIIDRVRKGLPPDSPDLYPQHKDYAALAEQEDERESGAISISNGSRGKISTYPGGRD